MKARVKATGEIVEINESSTIYDARMCHIYNASELENIPDTDPDYWTRLEHQYAGMAMQGMLSNIDLLVSLAKKKADNYPAKYIVAEFAKDCAHALVEKYKKEERK